MEGGTECGVFHLATVGATTETAPLARGLEMLAHVCIWLAAYRYSSMAELETS